MQCLAILLYLLVPIVKNLAVEETVIEIHIANDSLQTSALKPEVTLPLQFNNLSRKNLILYGFDSNQITYPADRICSSLSIAGGGISVVILNEKRERIYAMPTIPDSLNYVPMPKERFEQLMEQAQKKYLTGTKILNGASSDYSNRKLDLHEFPLQKGTYYLHIIVFAGAGLTVSVGEEQIEKDKRKYDADVYQGCAISNEIILLVD